MMSSVKQFTHALPQDMDQYDSAHCLNMCSTAKKVVYIFSEANKNDCLVRKIQTCFRKINYDYYIF